MGKAFGLDGKELGAALRAYRKKQGLSIENLADENISKTVVRATPVLWVLIPPSPLYQGFSALTETGK